MLVVLTLLAGMTTPKSPGAVQTMLDETSLCGWEGSIPLLFAVDDGRSALTISNDVSNLPMRQLLLAVASILISVHATYMAAVCVYIHYRD
jgi:hypothetical protein